MTNQRPLSAHDDDVDEDEETSDDQQRHVLVESLVELDVEALCAVHEDLLETRKAGEAHFDKVELPVGCLPVWW